MLTTRFEALITKEDEKFIDFYTWLQDIVNSMRGLEEDIKDLKIIKKILKSLPERFYPKITTIEECHDLDKLKLEELIGSIQTFELKLRKPSKKKGIALKVEENLSPDEDSDEKMALLVHRCKKVMKGKGRNIKKKSLFNRQS